jgi:hypothetical protein
LEAAIARANELAGPADDILVLTDRAPASTENFRAGLRWLALGKPQPNTAITVAERSPSEPVGSETLLVEISRFASSAETEPPPPARLRIAPLDGGEPIFDKQVTLDANGRTRQWLDLPPRTPDLLIELPDDALACDNRAVLLHSQPAVLPVAVRIEDAALRGLVERALEATGRTTPNILAPSMVFTTKLRPAGAQREAAAAEPWQFVLVPPQAPRVVRGPYLSDQGHPLLEGVALDDLALTTGTNSLPGRVLLYSGEQPLLTFDQPPRGVTSIHLLCAGGGEQLFRSPAWPALIWNAVQACSETQPGPMARNLRAGATARFTTPRGATEARFATPRGELTIPARGSVSTLTPRDPGQYRMLLGEGREEPFAVNFISPTESDLRELISGEWGRVTDAANLQRTHRAYAWLAALLALALLVWHHALLGRPSARSQQEEAS